MQIETKISMIVRTMANTEEQKSRISNMSHTLGKALLYIGDLHRYLYSYQLDDGDQAYSLACYHRAYQICPCLGHAYNQVSQLIPSPSIGSSRSE
jgi:hypothetical protein